MKLHQLLFGGALLLCVVFISQVLLRQDQIGTTKRPSASSGLERSISSLVQQQRRVETRLEALASGLAKLKRPPRSWAPQVAATQPAVTEAAPPAAEATAAAAAAEVTASAVQAAAAVEPADAECPGRRPFHALLTAQSSYYQQWQARIVPPLPRSPLDLRRISQARIMYHHWLKHLPYISLYLPTSPYISLHLPGAHHVPPLAQAARAAGPVRRHGRLHPHPHPHPHPQPEPDPSPSPSSNQVRRHGHPLSPYVSLYLPYIPPLPPRCGDMGGFTRLCATKGGTPDAYREI
jgi:hypothetical protein